MTIEPVHPIRPLIWTYDLAGVQTGTLHDFEDLVVETRLQGDELLSFTLKANDPKSIWIIGDAMLRYKNRRYRVYEINRHREGDGEPEITVLAQALWIDLTNFVHLDFFELVDQTLAAGLATILGYSDWTVGEVRTDALTYSMRLEDPTVLKMLREWSKVTQSEIAFDTDLKQVAFLSQQGIDRGVGFRYGNNLREIARTETPPICTQLIPLGADGLTIATVNGGVNYLSDFSYYTGLGMTLSAAQAAYSKTQIWKDESYTDASTLLAAAQARMAEIATGAIAYQAKVIDSSSIIGYPVDGFGIGDTVSVRDTQLGFDVSTRIVRIKKYPIDHIKDEIELGSFQLGLADIMPVTTTTGVIDPGGGSTFDRYNYDLLTDYNEIGTGISTVEVKLCRISWESAEDSSAIMGARMTGTSAGTGTMTIRWTLNAIQIGGVHEVDFSGGEPVSLAFPDWIEHITAGDQVAELWAQVTTGSGTASVGVGDARMYVLANGVVGEGSVEVEPTLGDVLGPVQVSQVLVKVLVGV